MPTKVYFWPGQHHDPSYTGGWVLGTSAAAVGGLGELRKLCASAGVHRPSSPCQARPDSDVAGAALASIGALLFRNGEPTGDESGEWEVIR